MTILQAFSALALAAVVTVAAVFAWTIAHDHDLMILAVGGALALGGAAVSSAQHAAGVALHDRRRDQYAAGSPRVTVDNSDRGQRSLMAPGGYGTWPGDEE